MKKTVEDIDVTIAHVKDLDHWLHKIQPINIMTQIYKAVNMGGDSRNRTKLEKYTSDVINQLLMVKVEPAAVFDRKYIDLPSIGSIESQLAAEKPTLGAGRVGRASPDPTLASIVETAK